MDKRLKEMGRGSKSALANHLGVDRTTVSRWISGDTDLAESAHHTRIAAFLGLPVRTLLSAGKEPGGEGDYRSLRMAAAKIESALAMVRSLVPDAPAEPTSASTFVIHQAELVRERWPEHVEQHMTVPDPTAWVDVVDDLVRELRERGAWTDADQRAWERWKHEEDVEDRPGPAEPVTWRMGGLDLDAIERVLRRIG